MYICINIFTKTLKILYLQDVVNSFSFTVIIFTPNSDFTRASASYPNVIHSPGRYGVELSHQCVGVSISLNASGLVPHNIFDILAGATFHPHRT